MTRVGSSPPKLSQTLTEEQYEKLKRLVPHGVRQRVFSLLIDGIITALERENGHMILGAILSHQAGALDLIRLGKELEERRYEEEHEHS